MECCPSVIISCVEVLHLVCLQNDFLFWMTMCRSKWHIHNYHTMYFYLVETPWCLNTKNTFPFALNPLSVTLEGVGMSMRQFAWLRLLSSLWLPAAQQVCTDSCAPWMTASWGFPPVAVYSTVVYVHIMWYACCTVQVCCIHWTWVVIERKCSKGQDISTMRVFISHESTYFVSDDDEFELLYWATCSKEGQSVGHFDQGNLRQSQYSFVTDEEPRGWSIVHRCYVIAQQQFKLVRRCSMSLYHIIVYPRIHQCKKPYVLFKRTGCWKYDHSA